MTFTDLLMSVHPEMSSVTLSAVFTFYSPRVKIFHLRFDDGLTVAEIARRLGLNPNTAYKYLMQSIQQIKNHFSKL